MLKLANALKAWGTPGFETALKEEVQKLDARSLPLQQGLSQSSHVSDAKISVVVLNVTETPDFIHAKTGIFYAGIIAGSCCSDDPTPVSENTEYCEVLFEINKITAGTMVTLLDNQPHMQEEGVIKFDLLFSAAEPVAMNSLQELNKWRSLLWRHRLIGQDPSCYEGYGFGNVSQRIGPFDAECGKRAFVISGTQTGELEELDNNHYAIVSAWDTAHNQVIASGPVKPSSESLTHAMIYDLDDEARVVLHVHSPDIWNSATARGIPLTDVSIEYGTPAMAQEVGRLFNQTSVRQSGIFAMGGHEDGVVSFGHTVEQAGHILLRALNESRDVAPRGIRS